MWQSDSTITGRTIATGCTHRWAWWNNGTASRRGPIACVCRYVMHCAAPLLIIHAVKIHKWHSFALAIIEVASCFVISLMSERLDQRQHWLLTMTHWMQKSTNSWENTATCTCCLYPLIMVDNGFFLDQQDHIYYHWSLLRWKLTSDQVCKHWRALLLLIMQLSIVSNSRTNLTGYYVSHCVCSEVDIPYSQHDSNSHIDNGFFLDQQDHIYYHWSLLRWKLTSDQVCKHWWALLLLIMQLSIVSNSRTNLTGYYVSHCVCSEVDIPYSQHDSNSHTVSCGVPHGSVLDLLLLLRGGGGGGCYGGPRIPNP